MAGSCVWFVASSSRARSSPSAGLRHALAVSCAVAAACPSSAVAQDRTTPAIVYCHDEARNSVRVVAHPGQCTGRIISASEAQRIGEARDARTQRIVGDRARNEARVAPPRGTRRGSGFFVSSSGLLLTNRHVVDACRALSITTADGRTIAAQLRAVAANEDIALLATRTAPAAFARFSSTPDSTSDVLIIVGYPRGSPTPRVATLSSASRGVADLRAAQHFYAIPGSVEPGHSGSPVLDQAGHVVGMVAARIRPRRVIPGAGQTENFVGAIPIATVTAFLALNDVRYESAPASEEWTDRELLDRARGFVARVNCDL